MLVYSTLRFLENWVYHHPLKDGPLCLAFGRLNLQHSKVIISFIQQLLALQTKTLGRLTLKRSWLYRANIWENKKATILQNAEHHIDRDTGYKLATLSKRSCDFLLSFWRWEPAKTKSGQVQVETRRPWMSQLRLNAQLLSVKPTLCFSKHINGLVRTPGLLPTVWLKTGEYLLVWFGWPIRYQLTIISFCCLTGQRYKKDVEMRLCSALNNYILYKAVAFRLYQFL